MRYTGDAGAAGSGEAGAAEAGASGSESLPVPTEGGAAGEAGTPSAGAPAGGASTGGTGGAVSPGGGSGGTAGSAPVCTPEGNATEVNIQTVLEPFPKVCRGAVFRGDFSYNGSDNTFTCCGTSDGTPSFTATVKGVYIGDGFGTMAFLVPDTAPLGDQAVALTCAPGPVTNAYNITVVDGPAPVVTGSNTDITASETLHITGQHLDQVSSIKLIPTDGTIHDNGNFCYPSSDTSTATNIDCDFDGVQPGDYYLLVQQTDCGYAANAPLVTIKPFSE